MRLVNPSDSILSCSLFYEGIEKVCLSAWCRPEGWVMTNDEISEYVNFNHRRFIGTQLKLLFPEEFQGLAQ